MIRFRDAIESDIPALIVLLADDMLGQAREDPARPERYVAAFHAMQRQGGRIILAVDDGGATVGCLQLNLLHGLSTRGQVRAQVESVRVAADRRGQGIGAVLMQEAIRCARDAGAGMMQLTTNLARDDARRFYVRLGFAHSHAGMKLDL